tara:strand:+ start:6941 stop:10672 length:3732 start_codon:yes stop_codon:yes gene_type:complete
MSTPNELTLVELPILHYLRDELGYTVLSPDDAMLARGGESQVLLRDDLIAALRDINDIPQSDAETIYADLARRTDNEEWLKLLRGNYSKKIAGEKSHRPIKIIDFEAPENNRFVVTNQLEIRGLSFRIPDVVVYVNGIPLVVIEAKSPLAKQDIFDAVTDIGVYEQELPRLFQTNLFNIATNGTSLRYGATGSPKEFWSEWKDPWPRKAAEFAGDPMQQGLWSLLEKGRLLDILAHFVVFETDNEVTIKKICRYQQFRAVNKLVDRVVDGQHRQGLIWHTQGSGKSLTMVFATLKLKFHHTLSSSQLENLNILVVTDRKGLDTQITRTFQNCGIPNPTHAQSIEDLRAQIAGAPKGKVVLSTIFKAQGSATPIEKAEDWIVLIDEAHRTQERDLGAFLRATFKGARFFGFTGTPVKTKDLDTRDNFSATGEDYLDRYGIEDAVADGATVPIRYMSRMPLWDLQGAKLDVLFDQEFAGLSDELREEIKARGVTRGDLARFEPRIQLISYDIWVHFQKNVQPDKMKAQIVAVDRKACTLYKRCLDTLIAERFVEQGMAETEAAKAAGAMSVCVYSSDGKNDLKKGNEALAEFYLDEEAEKQAIKRFNDPDDPLSFLIVCNKLLTGFDAPIEQAMYLDSPLTQHNLLQAIARTNRRYGSKKDHGAIIDYIGVTKDLGKALSSYKPSDVKDAMGSESMLTDKLKDCHAKAMIFLKDAKRSRDAQEDAKNGAAAIPAEDVWFQFRSAAAEFLRALAAVGSRPERLKYSNDGKYIASVIVFGKLRFEQKEELDFKEYSEKIRSMLEEHLAVTGLKTLLTLPSITDPGFWFAMNDSEDEKDLETAALTKSAALIKELRAKTAHNPATYGTLSERVEELIAKFQNDQIDAAELHKKTYELALQMVTKEVEYEELGLDSQAHGFYNILSKDLPTLDKKDGHRFGAGCTAKIVELFREWRHSGCDASAEKFVLGDSEDGAKAVVALLEDLANAPVPAALGEGEAGQAYANLSVRVVQAPKRIALAADPNISDLGPWRSFVFLGVEPLLLKLMAYLMPKEATELSNKRKGLSTLVTALQKRSRIPYDLTLSAKEFEADEGWEKRSAYNNAVRDVVAVRIAEAHMAPKRDKELWHSALVMMLGVVEHNADDLRAALSAADVTASPPAKESAEEGPFADLSDEQNALRQASEELRELYTSDATAPVNWQLNLAVKKDLVRSARRILKDVFSDSKKRKVAAHAIAQHAQKHFPKTRE